MKKYILTYSFVGFLILFIMIASFILFVEPNRELISKPHDTNDIVVIDKKELNVTYYEGSNINIDITYGNIIEKYIDVINNNDDEVVYSLKLIDSTLSNEDLLYSIYIAYDDEEYVPAIEDASLKINSSLVYNLLIKGHSKNSIKILFKSNHENENSNIQGRLVVSSNISSLELFNSTIKKISDTLDDKVDSLNGIYDPGYYILNIDNLSFENDANVKGYILIDAKDISDIKYMYTIFNDKYMIKNNSYPNINVENVDNNYTNTVDENVVCHQYDTRIKCMSFNIIPKSTVDDKKEFFNNSKEVINIFNKEFDKDDNKPYIYDISKDINNTTNLVGYILKNKNNMFLYIRNNIFMISGYDYKKLGDYDIKSKTIRSYNESAWNLSAVNKNKVCSFSGFKECYDKDGNII